MSFNDIKSELQQVLDSDVTLRKEFNELKRSLSDYRNQLILRDEDCKRLGVNIDVLNTKLTVMERDNTLYKSEISSFKELRANIKDQLVEKQAEIDARFEEINSLKAELDTIAARYETQIESVKQEAYNELAHVKQSYETQITDLRTGAHYKELGLKDEFENQVVISYWLFVIRFDTQAFVQIKLKLILTWHLYISKHCAKNRGEK